MNLAIKNISLEELRDAHNLSVRSLNACQNRGLNDLHSLLNYFSENKNFMRLRSCGNKSNDELIAICERYINCEIIEITSPSELQEKQRILKNSESKNKIQELIDNLSVKQKRLINNIIASQINELSIRSHNVLKNYTDSEFTLKKLNEIIINPNFKILKLRNAGKSTQIELEIFFRTIREQLELIKDINNQKELSIELCNSFLKRKFCNNDYIIKNIWYNYKIEEAPPIFKIINVLITHEVLFDSNERVVFERGFNFWKNNETSTLESIGNKIGITRERARQIKKQIYDNLLGTFSFIKGLDFDGLNYYGIDLDADLVIIDEDVIDEINKKESTNFNGIFITKIFSILLENTHALIGDFKASTKSNKQSCGKSYSWNSIYLVKKRITKWLSFEALVADVNRRNTERIEEDYSLHFEAYILNFQKSQHDVDYRKLLPIVEHILFCEFEIIIDVFDQITFKRKTKKQLNKLIYDILVEKNKPLDLYEIYDLLALKQPNAVKNTDALRSACQRDPNLMYFGRSSTYGLKSWEKDRTIKGGTMHDIAEEFLLKFKTPKHIDEIVKYVSQYRPEVTNRNLYYNLKSAENRRFSFFPNSYIGLIVKQYDAAFSTELSSAKTRMTWDESFELLTNFVNENNRLPLSTGIASEQKLYRFLNVQLRKSNKNKLKRINKLLEKYAKA